MIPRTSVFTPPPGYTRIKVVSSFDELISNRVSNAVSPKSFGNAVEDPKLVTHQKGQAAELSGENGFVFPGLGHFTRTDPFSLSIWVKTTSAAPKAIRSASANGRNAVAAT